MKKKILIVNSNYYKDISKNLILIAKKKLYKKNFKVSILDVPGIYEIPIAIRMNIKKFDGFVALGCVIKGETYHFEIVANESSRALTDLSINYSTPIGNGILTVSDKDQAIRRSDPNQLNKGAGAALACLSLINIKNSIDYE